MLRKAVFPPTTSTTTAAKRDRPNVPMNPLDLLSLPQFAPYKAILEKLKRGEPIVDDLPEDVRQKLEAYQRIKTAFAGGNLTEVQDIEQVRGLTEVVRQVQWLVHEASKASDLDTVLASIPDLAVLYNISLK